jgi:hypothetical protein
VLVAAALEALENGTEIGIGNAVVEVPVMELRCVVLIQQPVLTMQGHGETLFCLAASESVM